MILLDCLGRELHRPEGEEPLVGAATSAELRRFGLRELKVQTAVSLDAGAFTVGQQVNRRPPLSHQDALDESAGRNLAIHSGTIGPGINPWGRLGERAESLEGVFKLLIHRSLLVAVEDCADLRVVLLSTTALLLRLPLTGSLDSLSLSKALLARVWSTRI